MDNVSTPDGQAIALKRERAAALAADDQAGVKKADKALLELRSGNAKRAGRAETTDSGAEKKRGQRS